MKPHHICFNLHDPWSESDLYFYHKQSFEGDLFLGLAENQVIMEKILLVTI